MKNYIVSFLLGIVLACVACIITYLATERVAGNENNEDEYEYEIECEKDSVNGFKVEFF